MGYNILDCSVLLRNLVVFCEHFMRFSSFVQDNMPVCVIPRKTPQKGNPGYGKRRVSRPTRTTPGAVIGIYRLNKNGPLVAIVNVGERLAPRHYYNGFVSDKYSITVLSAGRRAYRAIMPQNLIGFKSNGLFSEETAVRLAPTNQGVAFVVLYADEDGVRHKAAETLQAAFRGFLARRDYARERAAAAEAEAAQTAAAAAWQHECFMHSLAQQFTCQLEQLNNSYSRGMFGPVGSLGADAQYRTAMLELQHHAQQNGLTPVY